MRSLAFAALLLLSLPVHAGDAPDARAQAKPATRTKRRLSLDELKKFFADEKDRITTEWVDNDTRQNLYEAFTRAGYIQVLGEGRRNEDGSTVYRKAFKSLADAYPDAVRMQQYCKTALAKDTFDRMDKDLQSRGYFLMQTQSFVDAAGAELISACWLKYASDPE
jgi:hypothetical protein